MPLTIANCLSIESKKGGAELRQVVQGSKLPVIVKTREVVFDPPFAEGSFE
jgi:hypothetical protein